MRLVCLLFCVAACGNITRNQDDGGVEEDAPGPSVTVTVTGNGSVSSNPAGINCGSDCTGSFAMGTTVVLTATPASGAVFTGWTGSGCTGTGTCEIVIGGGDVTVQAAFANQNTLTVTKAGTGMGGVMSSPTGINCGDNGGTDCTESYAPDTMVTLTATAMGDSVFTSWSGACTGATTTCDVTMDAAKTVTATFTLNRYALTVVRNGTGTGTVSNTPTGTACGTNCSEYDSGTMVTLTAAPATGSVFSGWAGGGCSGTGLTCMVTMTAATTVTATFTLDTYSITVTQPGTGMGTVTSSPSGINCGTTCSAQFAYNTMVTLTAAASTGSMFTGWGGACSGTQLTCMVTVTAAMSVTANFTINSYPLSVTKTGMGTVTSAPMGINCGGTCSANFNHGVQVTLSQTPANGYYFTGWGGACSGTGSCVVTMTAAASVTANFALNTLTVTRAGTGTGTVTSSPAGINCPTDCAEDYNVGSMVTLTAMAGSGSVFAGWSGACMGTGTCVVTMSQARAVTATFNLSCASPITVDIIATDRIDFNYSGVGTQVWRGDSYFRAYNDNFSPLDITGWLGFNLSSIPVGVTVTGMALHAYAQTVQMAPMVRLQYSASTNNWANATVQITDLPRTNLEISPAFLPALNAYNIWPINLSSQNFAPDFADDWLSIGVDQNGPAYAYAYFTSPTAASNKPFLRVTYCPCTSQSVTLQAVDSVTIAYPAGMIYRDNSPKAYNNPTGDCGGGPPCDLTGWFKFDTSTIPDTSTITSLRLSAYANTVQMGPTVRVQYSAGNTWTRAGAQHADLPRTNAQVGDPIAPTLNAYNVFAIDVTSQNWTPDLVDNVLTLGLDNTNLAYSYAYFTGSDPPPATNRAFLDVTYCQ